MPWTVAKNSNTTPTPAISAESNRRAATAAKTCICTKQYSYPRRITATPKPYVPTSNKLAKAVKPVTIPQDFVGFCSAVRTNQPVTIVVRIVIGTSDQPARTDSNFFDQFAVLLTCVMSLVRCKLPSQPPQANKTAAGKCAQGCETC